MLCIIPLAHFIADGRNFIIKYCEDGVMAATNSSRMRKVSSSIHCSHYEYGLLIPVYIIQFLPAEYNWKVSGHKKKGGHKFVIAKSYECYKCDE